MIKQYNQSSCIPVALYNALQFFGIKEDLPSLKRKLGTDRTGTCPEICKDVLSKYLQVTEIRKLRTRSSHHEQMIISVWDYFGDDHAIAITTSTYKSAFCTNFVMPDGTFEHVWVPWKELEQAWTGWGLRLREIR